MHRRPAPRFIHEYQLTPHSLYAAVSIGLECNTIVAVLNRLSKNALPCAVREFVRECTQNYGKVRRAVGVVQLR
jgi:DNA excision repair protein ERCC-3